MSHLHFVAADEYRNRVIQLGESPDRVFNVGGLGVDNIARTKLISRDELERDLQFKFQERNLLVTFHPVTLEPDSGVGQLTELLDALDTFPEIGLIFTDSNADIGGQLMNGLIEEYTNSHANAVSYASLGAVRYLSTLACVDGVIGNSSSGLLEAPSFMVGTVNIGDRQRGRLQARSVISCDPNQREIQIAIRKLLSKDFRNKLQNVVSPYGGPGARKSIVDCLKKTELLGLEVKTFFDVPKFVDESINASK
jgi:GDP/UDP-N,N'-diacetylbacillosamine 2-epimerase (hydrolysing)